VSASVELQLPLVIHVARDSDSEFGRSAPNRWLWTEQSLCYLSATQSQFGQLSQLFIVLL
jgi:hypothetical protein